MSPDESKEPTPVITHARFHPINAKILRALRRQLGWSQAELGKRAGYCERVIRKAEAGGSLNIDTIENLAQTFNSHNLRISTLELIYSEEAIARVYIESYDRLGVKMLDRCSPYICDDLIFNVPAKKTILKLAGIHHGKAEFQGFLDRFYSFFTRQPNSLKTLYLTAEGRVAAHFEEVLTYCGHELPPIWANVHFQFREGMIARIDHEFDYVTVMSALEEVRAKLGIRDDETPNDA